MRHHHALAIGLMIVLAMYNFSMAFLSATEKPALEYYNLPVQSQHKEYHSGDVVSFKFEFCVLRSTKYTITQKLLNVDTLEEYYLPTAIVDMRKWELRPTEDKIGDDDEDCRIANSTPKILPTNLPHGRYKFMWTGFSDGKYKNTVEYRYESQPFTVK